jgi:hypothetical protein
MTLVLAGNYAQFKYYFPNKDPNIRYIGGMESLIGYHGAQIIRVGTWWERDKGLIMECDVMENRFNAEK